MAKNFDYNVLNQDTNGADYDENDAEVISAERIA